MLPSVSCKVLSQENGGSVGSGKFPGGFSTRSRSSLISLLNFDTRITETLLLLFRDPAEALPRSYRLFLPSWVRGKKQRASESLKTALLSIAR